MGGDKMGRNEDRIRNDPRKRSQTTVTESKKTRVEHCAELPTPCAGVDYLNVRRGKE